MKAQSYYVLRPVIRLFLEYVYTTLANFRFQSGDAHLVHNTPPMSKVTQGSVSILSKSGDGFWQQDPLQVGPEPSLQ